MLRLRGAANVIDATNTQEDFVRKSSLVLWTPDVPYAVDGAVGIKATYGGGVNVRPSKDGFLVSDRGQAGAGALGLGLVLALAVPI